MSTNAADYWLRRHAASKADRMRHEHVWRNCCDLTFPELGEGFNGNTVEDASTVQNKKAEMLDSTGSDAARLLTSSVVGGMTPANSLWLGMDVGDESDEERRWLDHASERVWEAVHGGNFDAAGFEAQLVGVCVGWFVMYVDEDPADGSITFHLWPASQCYLAESKAGGRADIIMREFELTAEQAVAEYGNEVSDAVRKDAAEHPTRKHRFLWCIGPRSNYVPGSLNSQALPIASMHIECSQKRVIRERGYHEHPCVVPRWMRLPASVYATGPVANALPTIRELNELLRLHKISLARNAAGVYVGVDDGVFNPAGFRVTGGNVIVANSIDSLRELPTGTDFPVILETVRQMQAEIRRLLLADQMQPQDGPAMTATEVHVRVALIRQLLGPLFGRFQSEFLTPLVERVFGLLYRRGRPELGGRPGPVEIDDAPESLGDVPFRVRYQSPLARAQKLDGVAANERLVALAAMLAQAGKPEVMDMVDAEEAMREAQAGLGASAKVLRTDDALIAYRERKDEAAQAQAQAAQAQQMTTMAADAAMKQAAAV